MIKSKITHFLKNYNVLLILAFFNICSYVVVDHFVAKLDYAPSAYGTIGAVYQTHLNHDFYAFFTAMFIHGSWGHTLGNILFFSLSAYLFGRLWEEISNPNLLIFIGYLLSNTFSLFASSFFYPNNVLLGDSGSITAFITLDICLVLMLLIMTGFSDKSTFFKYGLLVVILLIFLIPMLLPSNGVAIITHWFGALFGLLAFVGILIVNKIV